MKLNNKIGGKKLFSSNYNPFPALLVLFVILCVGLNSFGDVTSDFNTTAKSITYTVLEDADKPFTDFHIRFGAPAFSDFDFESTAQPTTWNAPTIKRDGADIIVTWYDSDGSNPQTNANFVLHYTGSDTITAVGGTDWEVTNDKGIGTPFDGNNAGVIEHNSNDPNILHICSTDIPTVSQWGLIIMGLLLLAAGTVVIQRKLGTASA